MRSTDKKIFIYMIQQLNLYPKSLPDINQVSIESFTKDEYQVYKKYKDKFKQIYKVLQIQLQHIKKINKLDNHVMFDEFYNLFHESSAYTEIDFDSRSFVDAKIYEPLKFHRLEINLIERVRIMHVLYSCFKHNINRVDKNFSNAISNEKRNNFYLINYAINLLDLYINKESAYKISLNEPLTENDILMLIGEI